ncbi:DUF6038 family protein [Metalysinibacillus jejuensis]|uniref:DUF6038 family protein n=1 Tax=Metalysinibacillus jejuensis TaxID=914327 RepID=UPI000D3704B9|nr:DUF6038 family protein [Metalysinibacillus jejuensis]
MKTKKDLEVALGLTPKQLENKLERVFKLYDIDKILFKENEEVNSAYQFTEKSFSLLMVLINSLENYPLESTIKKMHDDDLNQKRQRSITAKELTGFNMKIIEAIDNMANIQSKADVLMSPVYEKAVLETLLLPMLEEKFSELIVATTTLDKGTMIEYTKYLIQMFDEGIYMAYLFKLDEEAAFEEELEEELGQMGHGLNPKDRELFQMDYCKRAREDRSIYNLDDKLAQMLKNDGEEQVYHKWKASPEFVSNLDNPKEEIQLEKTPPFSKELLKDIEDRVEVAKVKSQRLELMLQMRNVFFENLDEIAEANIADRKHRTARLISESEHLLEANASKYQQVKNDLALIRQGNVYAMNLENLDENRIGNRVIELLKEMVCIRTDIYYALRSIQNEQPVDTGKLILYQRLDDQLDYAHQVLQTIPNQALATTKSIQNPKFYEGVLAHYELIKKNMQDGTTANPAVTLHAFVEKLKKYAQK